MGLTNFFPKLPSNHDSLDLCLPIIWSYRHAPLNPAWISLLVRMHERPDWFCDSRRALRSFTTPPICPLPTPQGGLFPWHTEPISEIPSIWEN
jgi:hypothetical protein